MVLSRPSRFLEDIPRRILKPVFLIEEEDEDEDDWRSRRSRSW